MQVIFIWFENKICSYDICGWNEWKCFKVSIWRFFKNKFSFHKIVKWIEFYLYSYIVFLFSNYSFLSVSHILILTLLTYYLQYIEEKNMCGNSALHLAVTKGNFEVVKVLLKKGISCLFCFIYYIIDIFMCYKIFIDWSVAKNSI